MQEGAFEQMAQRQSPVDTKTAPASVVPAATRESLPPASFRKADYFDPEIRSQVMRDPVATAIMGSWRNRQQYGRVAYEQMMQHPAVAAPFRNILSVLKSIRVSYVAPQAEPTDRQREMADFLNAQIKRLEWTKIVDGWFGQGLMHGFSLAEMTTCVERWRGRPYVQIHQIVPLPQESLDDGSSMSEAWLGANSVFNPSYTCFDFDERGAIVGYHQYRRSMGDTSATSWTTRQERNRILHYKSGGGDGNPFGESIFYPAFKVWSDLYLLEVMEQVFLENSLPWLTASYQGDEVKPVLHDLFTAYISEQDPSKRVLIGNNITFGKVSASDPDYANHITEKKRELRDYITHAVLMPNSFYRETGLKDLDTRNLVQVFLKFVLPSLLDEIGEAMTKQFGKRLIDSNYSNVEQDDYPVFRWRFVTPNDLRLIGQMLSMAMPHLNSEKLGEVFAEYVPMFQGEYIAKNHNDSVAMKRPTSMPETESGPNDPPPKEEGEDRERVDGQTENAGSGVDADS